MLRNIIGPLFNFKNCVFSVVFLGLFFKTPLLSAGRTRFLKTKKAKKTKKMDHFLTLKRAKFGPLFNFTAYIYMVMYVDICIYIYTHIYVYAVEICSGPSLPILNAIIWGKFTCMQSVNLWHQNKKDVSAHLCKTSLVENSNIDGYYLGQVGQFFCTQSWPR